jgi:hypothetical protein
MPLQAIAEENATACRYCATIARAKVEGFWRRGFIPEPEDPTATVTFISFQSRTYAVTAWHVIEQFQRISQAEGSEFESYFVPQGEGAGIHLPFVRPPKGWHGHQPDVAIRPIDDRLPAHVRKKAFILLPDKAPEPVSRATAIGFPTGAKAVSTAHGGNRLLMSCVHAIADGITSYPDADQLQFFSEAPQQTDVQSLSGLSGGPVFWADEGRHGLLGFVKEALDVQPREGEETIFAGERVSFVCERASYDTFADWIACIDKEWPKQRDELNQRISAKLKSPPGASLPDEAEICERSSAVIAAPDLERLAQIARADLQHYIAGDPITRGGLATKILCVALCQGAAWHYLDKTTGVRDFDVFTFFAADGAKKFPRAAEPATTLALQSSAATPAMWAMPAGALM